MGRRQEFGEGAGRFLEVPPWGDQAVNTWSSN
jgi:hypothetical protein